MVTKTKTKIKSTGGNKKVTRRNRFENMTLEDEYLIRVLEGKPTKGIEKVLQRRRADEALAKKAKAKRKKRTSSW